MQCICCPWCGLVSDQHRKQELGGRWPSRMRPFWHVRSDTTARDKTGLLEDFTRMRPAHTIGGHLPCSAWRGPWRRRTARGLRLLLFCVSPLHSTWQGKTVRERQLHEYVKAVFTIAVSIDHLKDDSSCANRKIYCFHVTPQNTAGQFREWIEIALPIGAGKRKVYRSVPIKVHHLNESYSSSNMQLLNW